MAADSIFDHGISGAMHDVTSLLSFSLFLLAVAMQMQCPTCQAHPSEDLEEMKRGWNNFHSGYGKRAWNNNFMSGYGKRDSYEYVSKN